MSHMNHSHDVTEMDEDWWEAALQFCQDSIEDADDSIPYHIERGRE